MKMNKRMTLRNEILAKIQAGEKLEHFEVLNQEVNDKLNYYELKKSFEILDCYSLAKSDSFEFADFISSYHCELLEMIARYKTGHMSIDLIAKKYNELNQAVYFVNNNELVYVNDHSDSIEYRLSVNNRFKKILAKGYKLEPSNKKALRYNKDEVKYLIKAQRAFKVQKALLENFAVVE